MTHAWSGQARRGWVRIIGYLLLLISVAVQPSPFPSSQVSGPSCALLPTHKSDNIESSPETDAGDSCSCLALCCEDVERGLPVAITDVDQISNALLKRCIGGDLGAQL